jgi:DHA1 family multidrug resistance protein-like MFS transporter
MGFVKSAEQLIALRAIQGLVTGTVAAANALVAAEVPRNRIGYAMGLLQVGFGTGIATGPLIGGLLADAYGYSEAFYITSVLLFLAGVLVLFGVKENFQSKDKTDLQKTNFFQRWQKIIIAKGVAATFGLRFLTSLGRMMIIPIIPYFVEMLITDLDRLNTFTGLMMGVSSAATTISAVYLGKLGDKFGHRPIFITCTLTSVILYIPQSFVTSGWQLLILQVLVGVALGGILPAISALLANYTQHGEEGAVFGLDNSINSAGRSIAPLLGAWAASGWGIRATFGATAAIFLIGVVFALGFLPSNHINSHQETPEERL